MKNSKQSVAAKDATSVTNNVTEISKPAEVMIKDIMEEVEYVSKGVSVDIMRYAARFFNKVSNSEEGKKNNTFSVALLTDPDKQWLKKHCFENFLAYDKAGFKSLHYVKAVGMNVSPTYNLKLLIEKFEAYFERKLQEAGLIDAKGNVLKADDYERWYSRCSLYLHEHSFADQFKLGPINVITEKGNREKTSSFIPTGKKEHPPIVDTKTHIRNTVRKIQDTYESTLGIKIKDDMFAFSVA